MKEKDTDKKSEDILRFPVIIEEPNIDLKVQYGPRDSIIENSTLEFKFKANKTDVQRLLNAILNALNYK